MYVRPGAGGLPVPVTVQLAVALAVREPSETVTLNRCVPVVRPAYETGEEQATATPPSSEHDALETAPVVVHASVAAVSVVRAVGELVNVTVGAGEGAATGGGVGGDAGVGVAGGLTSGAGCVGADATTVQR